MLIWRIFFPHFFFTGVLPVFTCTSLRCVLGLMQMSVKLMDKVLAENYQYISLSLKWPELKVKKWNKIHWNRWMPAYLVLVCVNKPFMNDCNTHHLMKGKALQGVWLTSGCQCECSRRPLSAVPSGFWQPAVVAPVVCDKSVRQRVQQGKLIIWKLQLNWEHVSDCNDLTKQHKMCVKSVKTP